MKETAIQVTPDTEWVVAPAQPTYLEPIAASPSFVAELGKWQRSEERRKQFEASMQILHNQHSALMRNLGERAGALCTPSRAPVTAPKFRYSFFDFLKEIFS